MSILDAFNKHLSPGERAKMYRESLKEKGVCIECASEPAEENRVRCRRCLDATYKRVAATMKKHVEEGECMFCHNEIHKANLCEKHYTKQLSYNKAHRDRLKSVL